MWETILQVGGEGGKLTLKGMKLNDGSWIFTRIRNETTMVEVLPEADLESLGPVLHGQSQIVSGFKNGIKLMNSSWPFLHVLAVHPEFREEIWSIVSQSKIHRFTLRHWADLCFESHGYERYYQVINKNPDKWK